MKVFVGIHQLEATDEMDKLCICRWWLVKIASRATTMHKRNNPGKLGRDRQAKNRLIKSYLQADRDRFLQRNLLQIKEPFKLKPN